MIHFYNVTKLYQNKVKALSDVTLRIRRGEFVFLVGPSGAGKTTLIKLIFREELPNRGQLIFNGKNIICLRGREIPYLRRKIGVVFQDFRLLSDRTVSENIAFALEVTGTSYREIKRSVPTVLARVGLLEKARLLPSQLSGGEQQRVCIARAIVNKPLLIMADEPTGNLDLEASWEIMKIFEEINRKGTTVIMVTHAWKLVDTMKKRVIALSEGKIIRDEENGVYGYGA